MENQENKNEVSGRRGRSFKVTLDEQYTVYRSKLKELLYDQNKILPTIAVVFDKISQHFKGKITAKAIQLAVTRHADEIFGKDIVIKIKKIKVKIVTRIKKIQKN